MECILEGHAYSLKNYVCDVQIIEFMKKEKGEVTHDGTTNEEVLNMLISRMQYLNKTLPCRENSIVITKLEEALMWLNKRTQNRTIQNVEGTDTAHK